MPLTLFSKYAYADNLIFVHNARDRQTLEGHNISTLKAYFHKMETEAQQIKNGVICLPPQ